MHTSLAFIADVCVHRMLVNELEKSLYRFEKPES